MLAYVLTLIMYRKVTFYTTADGKCSVAEFIDFQPVKVAQKIAWLLKAVQEIEKVPKLYFTKLSDNDFQRFVADRGQTHCVLNSCYVDARNEKMYSGI